MPLNGRRPLNGHPPSSIILGEGCRGWSCLERGNGEGQKGGFLDVVKEDMAEVEVTEEDAVDRNNWRRKIRCGDP